MSMRESMKEIFLDERTQAPAEAGKKKHEVGAGPQDDLVLYREGL